MPRFWIVVILGVAALLAGCETAVVELASSGVQQESGEAYLQRAQALSKKSGAPVRVEPKAVVDKASFDFGVMDPQSSGVHEFVVRNEGSAPLTLTVRDTSCKCTVSSVAGGEIQPGSSTNVRMEWNTGSKVTHYRQWSRIETNDPESGTLTFEVHGLVRQELQFEPEEIDFGSLLPTESAEREMLVFSTSLDDFELVEASTSNPDFTATIEPAPEERVVLANARRAYLVKVKSPTNLAKGDFHEYLKLTLRRPTNDNQLEHMEFSLHGRTLGRISVLGARADQFSRIDFGVLRYGQGAKTRLRVKVRDEHPVLEVTKLDVNPAYLRATLTPTPTAATTGLYDLVIEIPDDAEPCAHRGDAMGKIHFEFAHPRVPKLDMNVDFSIRPPPELP